jgi:uncharacterized membrane protein (DUF485 family)
MTDPSAPPPDEHPHAIARNARYGMILFVIYVVFYAGFVALAAFSMEAMRKEIGGINVAVIYGMALIGFAFVLALIYMALIGRHKGGGPA